MPELHNLQENQIRTQEAGINMAILRAQIAKLDVFSTNQCKGSGYGVTRLVEFHRGVV